MPKHPEKPTDTSHDEQGDGNPGDLAPPWPTRLYRIALSVVVLVPLTVFGGFGGWLVLTITSALFGYDPKTADGDLLRDRLVEWPDRNREVMRTDGRVALPWKP